MSGDNLPWGSAEPYILRHFPELKARIDEHRKQCAERLRIAEEELALLPPDIVETTRALVLACPVDPAYGDHDLDGEEANLAETVLLIGTALNQERQRAS